jgi:hypothetical protein
MFDPCHRCRWWCRLPLPLSSVALADCAFWSVWSCCVSVCELEAASGALLDASGLELAASGLELALLDVDAVAAFCLETKALWSAADLGLGAGVDGGVDDVEPGNEDDDRNNGSW